MAKNTTVEFGMIAKRGGNKNKEFWLTTSWLVFITTSPNIFVLHVKVLPFITVGSSIMNQAVSILMFSLMVNHIP